jgi:transposase
MKKLTRRSKRFKGWTLGLDLHRKSMQYQWLNQRGDDQASAKLAATPELLRQLVKEVQAAGHAVQVCLEASGCFLWAYDLLVELVGREHVHVAAPSKVRVIAASQEKNDANDAWWLAYLTYEGRLPEAFVAEGALRELRIACREERAVIAERSDLQRRFRSHLAQLGRSLPKSVWASAKGQQQVEAVVTELAATAGQRGQAVRRLGTRIQALAQEAAYWREQAAQLAEAFPAVATLDAELPGVGPTVAAVVWSELGDPMRYRSPKAYGKATGLTPGYRESAGRRSKLGITREGSAHVRWALTRAILSCTRCRRGPGLAVKQWVAAREQRGKPRKLAMVAAARKLAEGIWRLFHLGEAFDLTRIFGRPRPV